MFYSVYRHCTLYLQICTLKAENLERDKDYRMKIHSLNKQNSDTVEELKVRQY